MAECMDQSPAPTPRDHRWLPRSRRSPGLARRQLREFLARVESGDRFAEVGELLLTELVTNAWQHGTRPGQRIWIGFELDPGSGQLYIAVEDASHTKPVPRPATGDQEAGRGLLLVEQLAHAWGCEPREGVGKRVWAIVGLAT